MQWILITGEYPPQTGGVSDYTQLVAERLVTAGDDVQVWAPMFPEAKIAQSGVKISRLPDRFGFSSLAILTKTFDLVSSDSSILVQYVPQAFGWKGMNLPFCIWLWSRRNRNNITVMFHEVATPWPKGHLNIRKLKLQFLAMVTRTMAWLVCQSAKRILVSIPSWQNMLDPLTSQRPVQWLPIPSTMPLQNDLESVENIRKNLLANNTYLVGHFGTYGKHIAEGVSQIVPQILRLNLQTVILLIGRGSTPFAESLKMQNPLIAERILSTGDLEAQSVSKHLAACDVLVQPYLDGVSSRRTSVMAGLALGRPIITMRGPLTEPIWGESQAVKLVDSLDEMVREVMLLLKDCLARDRLGKAAAALYNNHFHIDQTIARLRGSSLVMNLDVL